LQRRITAWPKVTLRENKTNGAKYLGVEANRASTLSKK
jgi:hypothetical protein